MNNNASHSAIIVTLALVYIERQGYSGATYYGLARILGINARNARYSCKLAEACQFIHIVRVGKGHGSKALVYLSELGRSEINERIERNRNYA